MSLGVFFLKVMAECAVIMVGPAMYDQPLLTKIFRSAWSAMTARASQPMPVSAACVLTAACWQLPLGFDGISFRRPWSMHTTVLCTMSHSEATLHAHAQCRWLSSVECPAAYTKLFVFAPL